MMAEQTLSTVGQTNEKEKQIETEKRMAQKRTLWRIVYRRVEAPTFDICEGRECERDNE